MYSTFKTSPPQSVGQLRLDLAVARSLSKSRAEGGAREGGGRRSHSAGQPRQRSLSVPLHASLYAYRRHAYRAERVAQGPPAQPLSAGKPRAKSASRRGISESLTRGLSMPNLHVGQDVRSNITSPASNTNMTPTKAELLHIRDRLAIDKRMFVSSYPVPPSPLRINGTVPDSGAAVPSPQANCFPRRHSVGGVVTPSPLRSPSKSHLVSSLEKELESVRRELEAEKQHSSALRVQAEDASSALDAKARKFNEEITRLEALVKKAEATAALAVADREQLRNTMATEVSDLKRELSHKANEVASLKQQLLEVQERKIPLPPPPPPPNNPGGYPLPRKRLGAAELRDAAAEAEMNHRSVTFNSAVHYRDASPEIETPVVVSGGGGVAELPQGLPDDVDIELVRDLRDMFIENDVENEGSITKVRLEKAFKEMESTFGLESSFDDVFSEKFGMGKGDSFRLSFQDFVNIMSVLPTRLATETALCFDDDDP